MISIYFPDFSGLLIVPVSPPDPMKRSKHYSSIQDEETSEKTPLLQSDESKKSKTEPTVKGPSLIKALFRTFGWELLHAQIFKLFYDVLVFVLPALLK